MFIGWSTLTTFSTHTHTHTHTKTDYENIKNLKRYTQT